MVHGQMTDEDRALQMKALYISHLATFTIWPQGKFSNELEPIRIGVLGDKGHEFAKAFETHDYPNNNEARSISVICLDGNPLEVAGAKREKRLAKMQSCHIIFIMASENVWLDRLFAEFAHDKILIIGETKQFLKLGGMAAFVVENDKDLKVWVNLNRVEEKHIKIGAMFLQHAKIVNMDDGTL